MNKLETMMSRIKLMSNFMAHIYLKQWCFTAEKTERTGNHMKCGVRVWVRKCRVT